MPEKTKGRKKRQPPPRYDEGEWRVVTSRPPEEYDPGALALHLDRRPADVLDEFGADAVTHLVTLVRRMLEVLIPEDEEGECFWNRNDVEGRILDHLLRRDGPESFRGRYFLGAVCKEVPKHRQDKTRGEARSRSLAGRDLSATWLRSSDDGQALADRRMATRELLDGIADERHREAVAMHVVGFSFEEIAEHLGVTAATASEWVHGHVDVQRSVERVYAAVKRRREQQPTRAEDGP